MKIQLFLAIALLVLGFTCKSDSDINYDLIISNVNLIDGTGSKIQKKVNIYIDEGKIIRLDSNEVTSKSSIIDGTNKYVIPGLYDAHVHTGNFKKDFQRLIHFGVTSIFVPGGSTCTNDYFAEMRAIAEQNIEPAPHVFHTSQHFTMEGRHPVKTYPGSHWRDGETVHYLRDTTQIKNLVAQVAKFPISGIKLTIEDGPAPPFVDRIPQIFVNKVTKEAHNLGIKVFAHVSDNIELEMALNAGIRNIVHYTGVNLDFDRDKEIIDLIYQSDFSWVTTLMIDKSFIYPLHPEWIEKSDIIQIYNAQEIGDYKDSQAIEKAKRFIDFFKSDYGIENPNLENIMKFQVDDIIELYENGVNMVLGTDTGNDFNFHGYSLHEEMQLLEMGGMSPMDIIKMGTHNAAKMLDVLQTSGTIETGKVADMVLLDKNPLDSISNTLSIHTVIKNGVIQKRINTSLRSN